jgi:hypothetical protein
MASCATQIAFLARAGITGPLEVFEGEKGLMDAITGVFEIDWTREDLDRVKHTILKKYNSEIHSQTAIEGALELQQRYGFTGEQVERIDVETFEVAYNIIGGGEEGDKTSEIATKEQADHSLPYVIAVAILDGGVMPEQYRPERIGRADVQQLLRRIHISPNPSYSERFPNEMPCRVRILLRGGRALAKEVRDYPGFFSQPFSWDAAVRKFGRIAELYFQRHGDQSAAMARIAAKNHRNGVANPLAQLRKDLGFHFCNTISDKNPLVAGPIRRTDCANGLPSSRNSMPCSSPSQSRKWRTMCSSTSSQSVTTSGRLIGSGPRAPRRSRQARRRALPPRRAGRARAHRGIRAPRAAARAIRSARAAVRA